LLEKLNLPLQYFVDNFDASEVESSLPQEIGWAVLDKGAKIVEKGIYKVSKNDFDDSHTFQTSEKMLDKFFNTWQDLNSRYHPKPAENAPKNEYPLLCYSRFCV
jgi:hypothetical protein